MSFLTPYLDTRQTESNLPHEESEELEQTQTEQTSQSPHGDDPQNDDNDEDKDETSTPPVVHIQKKKNTERLQFKPKKCTPAEEMVQIMKQNAELRKSKILKKQADLDDSDMFYLSMSKAAKTSPKIAQASVRMEVCKLVSEAQIRHFQHRSQFASSTPNSPHYF
ncbi:hypothetical protein GEV33_004082 [Tenebrio molitor]|uniref:Uncharacterized protein n=1 Tax=Tenebrio molitor TaxID=7067 RepID=A0A8J6LDR1_TENMO|nr:hypothetical protein GEV33_004082 [Tenebrio molitor]